MSNIESVTLPDVGDFDSIDVIEVLVAPGESVEAEQSLIVLESDKATMEIPSPKAGVVESVTVKVGDQISEGHEIITLKVSDSAPAAAADTPVETPPTEPEPVASAEPVPTPEPAVPTAAAPASAAGPVTINLPNVGDFADIEVIEVLISAGDQVQEEQSIIVLESDKATMDIPSTTSGTVESVSVSVGDRISEGHPIAVVIAAGGAAPSVPVQSDPPAEQPAPAAAPAAAVSSAPSSVESQQPGKERKPHPGTFESSSDSASGQSVHASPAVRRYARELGVDLAKVIGSGPKNRILKTDVKAFVKTAMSSGVSQGGGISVAAMPDIDYSKFGEVEAVPLSRIKKISGAHLHRSWVNVPHVTQTDDADITDLEDFRKSLAKESEKKGIRLTPLVFLMKAVVSALQAFPNFNASLDGSGEKLIMKKYFHIGVAVDTPNGLMVPVIRDVDQKGLWELAAELAEAAQQARDGKLPPARLQGGCFSISSLGGIGGSHFTPIVNAPEVAILGVSRSKMQPVYQEDGSFAPRLMLPLSLSYDHRVIDGADGARFISYLTAAISDIRRVLL